MRRIARMILLLESIMIGVSLIPTIEKAQETQRLEMNHIFVANEINDDYEQQFQEENEPLVSIEAENEPIVSTYIEKRYYNIPLSDSEQDLIMEICGRYDIDTKLILAIAKVESNFTINAIGDSGSSLGLCQIQPQWWMSFIGERNVLDLETNVDVACQIVRKLYLNASSTEEMLNAYNSGNYYNYNGYSERVMNAYNEIDWR